MNHPTSYVSPASVRLTKGFLSLCPQDVLGGVSFLSDCPGNLFLSFTIEAYLLFKPVSLWLVSIGSASWSWRFDDNCISVYIIFSGIYFSAGTRTRLHGCSLRSAAVVYLHMDQFRNIFISSSKLSTWIPKDWSSRSDTVHSFLRVLILPDNAMLLFYIGEEARRYPGNGAQIGVRGVLLLYNGMIPLLLYI